jgi:hypothetical protein
VPLSSAKRAWIAIAAVLLCLVAAGVAYYYWQSRPLPPIVSTLPGVPAAGPPPDILSQLPADAPVVAYIDAVNLRTLQNSPLAAALGLASPGPQADRDYANFVRDTGFDYTRDLDHAAIAMWPTSLMAPKPGPGNNLVMAIAEGRFDQQKIKAYALRTGRHGVWFTQEFYAVPGDPPVSFSFLSPTRIQITDTPGLPFVTPAVSAAEKNEMKAQIKRVAGAPIFAVARTDSLPQSIYAPLHNSPQLEQIARSVQAITLAGQPDRDNLKVTLDAECDTLKNAVQLAFLLETGKMAGSMALSDPRTRRQMTREQYAFLEALINRATINHQNKVVRITLEITPDMLAAAPPPKPAASGPPATTHAPPPAAYPKSSQ